MSVNAGKRGLAVNLDGKIRTLRFTIGNTEDLQKIVTDFCLANKSIEPGTLMTLDKIILGNWLRIPQIMRWSLYFALKGRDPKITEEEVAGIIDHDDVDWQKLETYLTQAYYLFMDPLRAPLFKDLVKVQELQREAQQAQADYDLLVGQRKIDKINSNIKLMMENPDLLEVPKAPVKLPPQIKPTPAPTAPEDPAEEDPGESPGIPG